MSYKTFPPLQAPETYNLDGILKAIQAANWQHPSEKAQASAWGGCPFVGRPLPLPARHPIP